MIELNMGDPILWLISSITLNVCEVSLR